MPASSRAFVLILHDSGPQPFLTGSVSEIIFKDRQYK